MIHKLRYTPLMRKEYLAQRSFLEALTRVRDRINEDIRAAEEDIEAIEKYYDVPEEDKQ